MAHSPIQRFFAWLSADTVFARSCMFIAGGCLTAGLTWAVAPEWPLEPSWLLAPVGIFALFGLALLFIPIFASDQRFERYQDLMADGGDIPVAIFFLLVAIVAVPLTMVVRSAKKAFR